MDKIYKYAAVVLVLFAATMAVSWLQVNYLGQLLNEPMTHLNCTVKYECHKFGLSQIDCSCTYSQTCKDSQFAQGCKVMT